MGGVGWRCACRTLLGSIWIGVRAVLVHVQHSANAVLRTHVTRDMGEAIRTMGTRINVTCKHDWKLHKVKRRKRTVKSIYHCVVCGKRRVVTEDIEE